MYNLFKKDTRGERDKIIPVSALHKDWNYKSEFPGSIKEEEHKKTMSRKDPSRPWRKKKNLTVEVGKIAAGKNKKKQNRLMKCYHCSTRSHCVQHKPASHCLEWWPFQSSALDFL